MGHLIGMILQGLCEAYFMFMPLRVVLWTIALSVVALGVFVAARSYG